MPEIINIFNRVCRELTRLSRSKHTLVNILTIGEIEHPYMTHHFETTENSTQPIGIWLWKKNSKKLICSKVMAYFLFSFIGPSQYIAHPSQYFE